MSQTGELSIAFVSQVPQLYEASLAFLSQYEKSACALYESLLRKDKHLYVVFRSFLQSVSIEGLFSFNGETILCQFKNASAQLRSCLSDFFSDAKVTCLAGQEHSVKLMAEALKNTANGSANEVRTFMLMECRAPVEAKQKVLVRLATEADEDSVLEMHLAFLKEEVAPAWLKETIENRESLERRSVRRKISKKVFRLIEQEDSVFCLARFDVQTPHYVQIAGVYTNPAFRNKGYAKSLVCQLTKEICALEKSAVLFVDVTNEAACHVYQSAGFVAFDRYRICYYK